MYPGVHCQTTVPVYFRGLLKPPEHHHFNDIEGFKGVIKPPEPHRINGIEGFKQNITALIASRGLRG